MNKYDRKAAQIFQNAAAAGRVLEIPRNGHGKTDPIVQAAHQVVGAAQEAARAPEASAAMAQEAQMRVGAHQHAILRMLLSERQQRGEIPSADPEILDQDGILACFNEPDGSVRFDLDEKPLIQFWPPTAAFDEQGMNVQLPYRVAL